MSITNAKQAAALVGTAIAGLDIIARLTHNTTDDRAVEILTGIREVISALSRGAAGTITLDACEAEIRVLHDRLAATDRAADARLRDRFDPHETSGDD